MRVCVLLFISGVLCGCGLMAPKPENKSGLEVKILEVKNHGEGVDITVALNNTTDQKMRLFNQGSVSVLLDGSYRTKGRLAETADIRPGERKKVQMQFRFINAPRIYKYGLIEIVPAKVFPSCRLADADPDVVRDEDGDEGRELAMEVQSDTCDRALKRPIRVAF